MIKTPKMFQFYFHKDRALNRAMIARAKEANFDVLALTVDTITGETGSGICAPVSHRHQASP